MGHLSGAVSSSANDEHQSLRTRAASLSRTAWDAVVTSGSTVSAWATILMEGRSNKGENALAASANSTPEAYLALKAKSFKSDGARLKAVVSDVEAKTIEADSFIAFAQAVASDSEKRLSAFEQASDAAAADRQREMLSQDRRVLEQAVADLRSQKATYAQVERELREVSPPLDTSSLKAALQELGTRIVRLARTRARHERLINSGGVRRNALSVVERGARSCKGEGAARRWRFFNTKITKNAPRAPRTSSCPSCLALCP